MNRAIVFVVDTSVSMGQPTASGLSYLDVCKAAVEHYLKKSVFTRNERPFLVTCGPKASGVVVGWKDGAARLGEELKSLRAEHAGDLGAAMRRAFDLLNAHRLQSGVDQYGLGRKPWLNAQGTVLVLTEGGATMLGMGEPGNALTPEWYRWDQRLFVVVANLPRLLGSPIETGRPENAVGAELQRLAEQTGGGAYFAGAVGGVLAAVESVLERTLFPGVTTVLECLSPVPRGLSVSTAQFVRLPVASPGQPPLRLWWPWPEDYHVTLDGLQAEAASASSAAGVGPFSRAAHPTLVFAAADKKLSLLPSFPVDKYELEPSAFTAFFLKNVKENMCWPLLSRFNQPVKSFKNGTLHQSSSSEGKLVGFVKQSSNRAGVVNLYMLPYNYPELFTLLDELVVRLKNIATPAWQTNFESYLRNLPYYYLAPLRSCLAHLGLPPVVPPKLDSTVPRQLAACVARLAAQAKTDAERLDAEIEAERRSVAAVAARSSAPGPLSLPRARLLTELSALRKGENSASASSSSSSSLDNQRRFSLPVAAMGDYNAPRSPVLRDARGDESTRAPLFGNPFFALEKVAGRLKKGGLVLDEAEPEEVRKKTRLSPEGRSPPRAAEGRSPSPTELAHGAK